MDRAKYCYACLCIDGHYYSIITDVIFEFVNRRYGNASKEDGHFTNCIHLRYIYTAEITRRRRLTMNGPKHAAVPRRTEGKYATSIYIYIYMYIHIYSIVDRST